MTWWSLFWGIYTMKITKKEIDAICKKMFTVALIIIGKPWKPPKGFATGEWLSKLWNITVMEYYITILNDKSEFSVNTWESVYRKMIGEQGRVWNRMDKLISVLENDAYTMTIHKRSLNYVNSWCEEAKRFFFFPLENCLNAHFFKSGWAAEASQHALAVSLICRVLSGNFPLQGKKGRLGDIQSQRWVKEVGQEGRGHQGRGDQVLCQNGPWWGRLCREMSKDRTRRAIQKIGRREDTKDPRG